MSDDIKNCSSSLLAFNKVNSQYIFIFGNRKSKKLFGIQTKPSANNMKKALQEDNLRLVHSKFKNLYFDGVDSLVVKGESSEFRLELEDAQEFAS